MENKSIVFTNWREEYKCALDMAYKHAIKTIDTAPELMDVSLVLRFPVCVRLSVGDEESAKGWR